MAPRERRVLLAYGILHVVLSSIRRADAQAAGLFGLVNQGDATYYSTSYGSGACSFAQGSVQYSPWVSGTNTIVAVNAAQYFGSQTCGLCVTFKGLGPGSGANPVSKLPQFAIVGDLCPECKQGDLDMATVGDGRFTISWSPVQCNVGSSNFIYSFQGSNMYYLKLQVANTRVPVLSVSIKYNGKFVPMDRASDNYFIKFSEGGIAFTLPTSLAITSILNDTVYDTLATSMPSGNVPGGVQFPMSQQWPAIGSTSAESSTPLPVRSPPPPLGKSPPPPQPTSKPPPPKPSSSPPPPKAPSPPPPQQRSPPPPAPVQTAISIQPYQQCGGAGAACVGSQCKDAPYAGTKCAADDKGQVFGCTRINQYYYQCLPSRLAAVQNAAIESAETVPTPPSSRTESATPCDLPVGNNLQCGGKGGVCDNGKAPCVDNNWADACCTGEGFSCLRYSSSYWECRDKPFPA